MKDEKVQKFTDLIAWQKGHKLVLMTYKFTQSFPSEELYGLTNQIRRCAVSITSNLAEGFGRSSKKEKVQFYFTSQGSLAEFQNQLLIARDVGYINEHTFKEMAGLTVEVYRLIRGLAKSARSIANS